MTVSDELIAFAAKTSVASVHEASGRKGALPETIRPIDTRMAMRGRAFTVRCPSGDNLWIHKALVEARQGDVLIVDAGPAGARFGYWGEIMATAAVASGLSGLVISGGVRDLNQLLQIGFPTFSVSISILGTVKDDGGDGALRGTIRIGETSIRQGDLIMGDADGIVALSPGIAEWAIPAAIQRDDKEVAILERIRKGESTLDVYQL